MSHQLLGMLATSAAGYTMIYTGLAKRVLRTRAGGRRCASCGRYCHDCSCGRR